MEVEKENNINNDENKQFEIGNENNEEEEENDINVYDDKAYILDENENENYSHNNSLNNSKHQDELNNFPYQEYELDNKNEIEGLDDPQIEDNNDQNNNNLNYLDQKINSNKNEIENNSIQNILGEKNEINLNNNKNNSKDMEINEINNKKINNEENNINEMDNIEGEEEMEGNLPLVTLKYVSICQSCKNPFNNKKHIPYLFKCGHFFCKECIQEQFTDEEGIKCPIDGVIAQKISEFKILNNLMNEQTIQSQRADSNFCSIHKNQKLTHIVLNTKEIVCVYCAFDLVKKNPNYEIKELSEIFEEYSNIADKLIHINQNNIEIIQKSLKDIKDNKQQEVKNVMIYFEHIIKYLNTKKDEILSKIDTIFTENASILSQKLENFSSQIESGENLKKLINNYEKNKNGNYINIYESYLQMKNLNEKEKGNKIKLKEYKFIHDEESNMMNFINSYGDIRYAYKFIPFQNDKFGSLFPDNRNNTTSFDSPENINNNNINSNYLNTYGNEINQSNNSKTYIYNQTFSNNFSENNLKYNNLNKKPYNYIGFQNINKNDIGNNNKNRINCMKYNKEKVYNNNLKYLNNNNYRCNKSFFNNSKKIKSPALYGCSHCNKDHSNHRMPSPGNYTYSLIINNI